jgi:hypothetical protein
MAPSETICGRLLREGALSKLRFVSPVWKDVDARDKPAHDE